MISLHLLPRFLRYFCNISDAAVTTACLQDYRRLIWLRIYLIHANKSVVPSLFCPIIIFYQEFMSLQVTPLSALNSCDISEASMPVFLQPISSNPAILVLKHIRTNLQKTALPYNHIRTNNSCHYKTQQHKRRELKIAIASNSTYNVLSPVARIA